jgi:tripartite-type tricarboxylate transporter receptor subunit TctC
MGAPLRVIAALLLLLCYSAASPQTFPTRPVRYICPLPAGGDVDLVTRVVAGKLGELWGQQVVVDNRAGAAGTIGAALAAKSNPDGYTLFAGGAGTLIIAPVLYRELPYDGLRAFAPVSLIGTTPMVLVVHPSAPMKSVNELIAYAKAHPGKITYGSAGVGSFIHLPMEMFKAQAGVNLVHVPYKGAAPALAELIGGHVHALFAGVPLLQPHIKSGKLRALAVSTAARTAHLPNVPTVSESGLPGFEVLFWFTTMAPAATPKPIVDRLSADIARALTFPDVQRRFADDGLDIVASTPQQAAMFLQAEAAKWTKVVKDAGITMD